MQTIVIHQIAYLNCCSNFFSLPQTDCLTDKNVNKLRELQSHDLSTVINSLKEWVVSAHQKELQPILEQVMQNSVDIKNQRHKLNSLKDVKTKVSKFSFFLYYKISN